MNAAEFHAMCVARIKTMRSVNQDTPVGTRVEVLHPIFVAEDRVPTPYTGRFGTIVAIDGATVDVEVDLNLFERGFGEVVADWGDCLNLPTTLPRTAKFSIDEVRILPHH